MSISDELCPQIALHALGNYTQRQLPEGYQIALRFSQGDYTAVLLDPDGTQISCGARQKFAVLCDIAQADAKRRASE